MKKFYTLAIFTIIANLLIISPAFAQTNTWNGSSSNNWNTAANWSLNAVPTNAHNVVININATINVDVNSTINSLTVNGNAVVSFTSSGGARTITIDNNGSTIASGSTLTLQGSTGSGTRSMNLAFAAGGTRTMSIAGTLVLTDVGEGSGYSATNSVTTVTGVIKNDGAAGTGFNATITSTTGNLSFSSGGTYNHALNGGAIPTATWNANSTVEFSKGGTIDLTGVGNYTIGKMLVTNNTAVSFSGGGGNQTFNISNGTGDDLIVNSGSSLTFNSNYENIVLAAGATANISGTFTNGGTYNTSAATTVTTVNGTFVNSNTVNGATAAKFIVADGGIYQHAQNGGTIPTATWATTSTCLITGITSTLPISTSLNQTFGNFTWNCTGQTVWPSGNIAPTTMQVDGNLTIEATGPVGNLRDFSVNQATALTIGGDLIVTGGRYTVCYTTTNNQTRTVNVAGNVQVSGGELTITASAATNNTGVLNVNGNITISGGTLNLSNDSQLGTIYAKGDYNHSSGTVTETGTNTASTIYFAGNGTPQTYTSGGTVSQIVNFTVNSGSTLQMAAANTVVSGGGTFTLSSGAGLGITSTAGITSSGATGNIQTTSRSFAQGATYIYDGTGGAQVTGNGMPINISNLTINNASGVTLSQNTALATVLTLTNGVLTTTSGNLLTMNSGSNVSGASNSSFVDGPIAKTGNTSFTFPVGKTGTGYQPCGISKLSGSTTFTAEYIRSSGAAKGASNSPLQAVSNCEHWMIFPSSAVTAAITIYWNTNSSCGTGGYINGPFPNPYLRVARYNGASGSTWSNSSNDNLQGGSNTVSSGDMTAGDNGGVIGTISIPASTFASPVFFTFGTTNTDNSPLPVMFDNVKAYAKNSGVQIEWSNLTERDLKGYAVERSEDGRSFHDISIYMPISNLNNKADYTSFDATPVAGTNFYRIRATEIGGKIIYSKVLRVDMSGTQSFSMYPNPVTGRQLTVSLTGMAQGSYNIRIVNTNGQDVFKKVIKNSSSSTSEMIELPVSTKAGIYTMLISGDNFNATKMFIVQ